MSPPTEPEVQQKRGTEAISTAWLGAGLVVVLGTVLVALNLLAPPSTQVSRERLNALLERGLVVQMETRGDEVVAQLSQPVRLREERQVVSAVKAFLPTAPDSAQVSQWRSSGVRVDVRAQDQAREWIWGTAIALLLGGGVWHLVTQAHRHRLEGGPRQRLAEVEEDYRAGRLTPEEYEKLVSKLTLQV